jgi:hypothetical protein
LNLQQTDAIDLGGLLTRAKSMRIPLVAEEWIEADGKRFPGTNEGSAQADAYLMEKHNTTDHYQCMHMKHWKQLGRPMYEIVKDLNKAMKELGIEPQEYGYNYSDYPWRTPKEAQEQARHSLERRLYSDQEFTELMHREQGRPLPLGYRWLACYPVEGSSEGWYMHIDVIYQTPPEKREDIKVIRDLIARVDRAYDKDTYTADRELIARAKLLSYEPADTRIMLALAKTWDWENACACSAVAATLLGA